MLRNASYYNFASQTSPHESHVEPRDGLHSNSKLFDAATKAANERTPEQGTGGASWLSLNFGAGYRYVPLNLNLSPPRDNILQPKNHL